MTMDAVHVNVIVPQITAWTEVAICCVQMVLLEMILVVLFAHVRSYCALLENIIVI